MTTQQVTKASFIIFVSSLLVVGYFKLATPLLTVLFSYFALTHFAFRGRKWIAIVLFILAVALIFYGFISFVRQSVIALPNIAETSVPKVIEFTKKHGFDLPFNDVQGLKDVVVDAVTEQVKGLARFAQVATEEFIFLIIGLVVAISLYISNKIDLDHGKYEISNNLYSALATAVTTRFSRLYESFSTVMGAQIVISLINTISTAILVTVLGLPHPQLIIPLTFLCGLLPIIGNLLSNTFICGVAITISVKFAIICLIFLILVHKLEYFLNSKIIGGRIRNAMWLTLLALIAGERIMGVAGMILAPVLLNYIKLECSKVEVLEMK